MIRHLTPGHAGFLLAVLWLSSCGPELQFVASDYNGKTIGEATLSVVRLNPSRMRIDNLDDVLDDLGASSVETFRTFFEYEMELELTRLGTFRSVWFDTLAPSVTMKPVTLPMTDKTDLIADLPANGEPVITDSAQADFTLLIPYLDVSRYAGKGPTMVMGPRGQSSMVGGESAALDFASDYVVWDNKKGAVVAYGKLHQRQAFFMAMTAGTWSDAVTNLARAILTKSPFRNPAPPYKSDRFKTKPLK